MLPIGAIYGHPQDATASIRFGDERSRADNDSILLPHHDLAAFDDIGGPDVIDIGIRSIVVLLSPSLAHARKDQLANRWLIVGLEVSDHDQILPSARPTAHYRRSGAAVGPPVETSTLRP
jgi:hypothetical protein